MPNDTLTRFASVLSVLATLPVFPSIRHPALSAQDLDVNVVLTEGTNMAAALSPDRQTLAIDLIGRIWVMPANGGAATPITDEFGESQCA